VKSGSVTEDSVSAVGDDIRYGLQPSECGYLKSKDSSRTVLLKSQSRARRLVLSGSVVVVVVGAVSLNTSIPRLLALLFAVRLRLTFINYR